MRGAALFQQHHIPHSGATSRASQPAHQAPAIHHVTGRRCTSFLPPVRQQFSTSLTCQLLKDRQAASNRQQPAQQQHDHRRPMRTPTRMCGIIGIYKSQGPVNSEIYEGLLMLQHRGQDSAGMVTLEGQKFIEHKANGLVKDVFNNQKTMDKLKGSVGLGHVRYPTAGTSSVQEAQPFFVNSPLGMYLVHNGNITNTDELKVLLNSSSSFFNRYLRTNSDSEVLLNVLADEIHRAHQRCMQEGVQCNPTDRKMELVFEAGTSTMKLLKGAYSCISMIAGVGLVAFRDPFGIRTFAGVHRGTPRAALHRRTSTSERLDLHVLLRCMQPVLSSCAASCNDVKRFT